MFGGKQYDEKQYIISIIFGVVNIIFCIANCIYQRTIGTILIMIFIIGLSLLVIGVACKIKKRTDQNNLIKYIYFGSPYNRFTYLPKLLLYMDYKKKKNQVSVGNVCLDCKYVQKGDDKSTHISWTLEHIKSKSKIRQLYFYTLIDIGKIKNQAIAYEKRGHDVQMTPYSERCNGVTLLYYTLENGLSNQKQIKKFVMMQETANAFNFNRNEVIFIVPQNYGQTIDCIEIKINAIGIEQMNDIKAAIHEIGKIGSEIEDVELEWQSGDNQRQNDGSFYFYFKLEKDDINMNSIYYVLFEKYRKNYSD